MERVRDDLMADGLELRGDGGVQRLLRAQDEQAALRRAQRLEQLLVLGREAERGERAEGPRGQVGASEADVDGLEHDVEDGYHHVGDGQALCVLRRQLVREQRGRSRLPRRQRVGVVPAVARCWRVREGGVGVARCWRVRVGGVGVARCWRVRVGGVGGAVG
jgi:hypothetical protein